jgi:superfamily II DNA/RNA helicase
LQGIDLPDVTLVVQYRVPKELSTFIQRAGRAARNPNLQATAVLLAEPSYFDDEKEKAAQRAAERNAKKRAADGHLQPSVAKQPCSSLDGSRDRGEVVEVVVPEIATESRCEPAMDNFLNADRRPEKCRRKVVNNHFGNNDLCKSFLHLSYRNILTIIVPFPPSRFPSSARRLPLLLPSLRPS